MATGELYECYVNGKRIVVKILEVKPFGSGIKILFQDAANPGRKMQRYSTHDFRPIPAAK